MSRSINQLTLIGNMGADPEVRTTHGGAKVCEFSLATTRKWTKRNGDEEEKTEWHRCVAWNRRTGPQYADIVERHGRKGLRTFVQGRVEYRSFEHNGKTKQVTEVVVEEFLALHGPQQEVSDQPPRYQ